MAALAAEQPRFDFTACAPHVHSQNVAEADIKAWRLRIRAAVNNALKDPKSKVVPAINWPGASECIGAMENQTFRAQSPEKTPWEAVYRVQPDAPIWQIPLCRIWYFVYPNLRENAPFANRRAEAIFAGYSTTSSSYKIRNLATGRLIERRYADCVTREPHEVFYYAGIVRAAGQLYSSGKSAYRAEDRSSMVEGFVYDNDNMADMDKGNDPDEYFVGPRPVVAGQQEDDEDESSDSDDADGKDPDSDGEDPDSEDWQEYITEKDNETPLQIARKFNVTVQKLVARNTSKSGEPKLFQKSMLKKGSGLWVPSNSARAYQAREGKPGGRAVPRDHTGLHFAMLARDLHTDASRFADSVLGTGNLPAAPQAFSKQLPRQMRPNGGLLEQVVAVDMSDTRNARAKKNTDLRNGVLHALLADIQDHVKQPASYAAGLKDAQQAQHWKDGDAAEWKRIKDSSAATIVPYE